MSSAMENIVTILVAITGVAILAVVVSKRSNTAGVISSTFGGFSQALAVAVSPVTGGGGLGGNFGGANIGGISY